MKFSHVIKKFFASLLAFFLLATSTGVEINAHYCKTKLVSLNLWGEAVSCLQGADQENSNNTDNSISKQNCCGSKTVFSKADIESEIVSIDFEPLLYGSFQSVCNYSLIITNILPHEAAYSKSPPLKNSKVILYQNYRI